MRFERTDAFSKKLYYLSPTNIDSGNWYLQYSEVEPHNQGTTVCNASLHLLSCPLEIGSIKVKWKLHIQYNDYSRSMSDVCILLVGNKCDQGSNLIGLCSK